MRAGCAAVGIVFFFCMPHSLLSQPRDSLRIANEWNYSVECPSFFSVEHFLPKLFRREAELKRYIRDPRFLVLRLADGDTMAVDAIFDRAMEIANGGIGTALWLCAFATMDHFRIGAEIPFLGVLPIPLTTESHENFRIRLSHLPRRVLPDSVGRKANDRDKLQHFFGSAYLTYTSNSKSLANDVGNFVEWGEPKFIVGGTNDNRDKFANRLGQQFGMMLLDGGDVLPSDVLWYSSKEDAQKVSGTGRIVYMSFEEGFYGIITDKGEHYLPENLGVDFQKDSLRVFFEGVLTNRTTTTMWGRTIKLNYIERTE
jgi:hypothetical protein